VDRKVFKAFFDQHSKKVYTYIYWVVRNKECCDDILQAVFLKLWHKTLTPEDEESLSKWLIMVARNECMDFFRKQSQSARLRTRYNHETSPYSSETPADHVSAWDMLGGLAEQDREILFLHLREGYSYKEIADNQATTENAIRVRAFRALARLRKKYIEEQQ
jgi:RNA polymerase sigma factor (sigma-70 family)